jgi:hypothetical protein
VWIERAIGAIAGCSAVADAAPAPGTASPQGAAGWKTAAGSCPSSPFVKPAALRQLLAQR